jgi:hypothetical protein
VTPLQAFWAHQKGMYIIQGMTRELKTVCTPKTVWFFVQNSIFEILEKKTDRVFQFIN